MFKVVRMADLFEWPTAWKDHEQEFATRFEAALNRMAADGWEFVGNYVYHGYQGAGYAVFRRTGTQD